MASALGDLEKAVVETEQRLAGMATKVDSVLNSSGGKGVSATNVLEEFHTVKTNLKSIVEQVEAFKKEQNQFLQDIQVLVTQSLFSVIFYDVNVAQIGY